VALLLAILLPSLGGARDLAAQVQCMSNLRQNATAMLNYIDDNNEALPRAYGSDIVDGGSDPGNRFSWFTRLVGLNYLTAPNQQPLTGSDPHAVSIPGSSLMCPKALPGRRDTWGWAATFSFDDPWYSYSWREQDNTGYPGKPAVFSVDSSYAINASQGDWTGMGQAGGNPFLAQWQQSHRLNIQRRLFRLNRSSGLMMLADGSDYRFGRSMAYVNPKHGGVSTVDNALTTANMVFFDGHVTSLDPRDIGLQGVIGWSDTPSRAKRNEAPFFRIQD
jgi:prepilin-type processing-associated H-X9-DG protein